MLKDPLCLLGEVSNLYLASYECDRTTCMSELYISTHKSDTVF